ncbi:MAG TPA: carbamoyltransferase N-terminal domain-containing protein [Lacunisphaera sp.]|jgi:carbamoyltransferase|nr:carbamoyltransferase N-terminal domain-containing protein [Lacunisphaera sp.]
MRLLGLSAYYHDSAAALLDDGVIVAAAQEERFSRVKHDNRFPHSAAAWCLAQARGPLDAVVYYEKPLLKFERILATAAAVAPRGFRAFAAALPGWLNEKLWLPGVIEDEIARLGCARVPVHFTGHHEAHAASAFFPSPFPHAAILTLDGVGEWTTTALGRGADNQIELLRELRFPHSLGLLYSAFTYHCGFRVNSGEYKLMGLAPYGEPRHAAAILAHLIDLKPDGSFRLHLDYFGYLLGETMTNDRFTALFGLPPRRPDELITQAHCDLARSVQQVTEEIVLRLARTLRQMTGEDNLCLAGGVALNCVANSRLLREGPFKQVWIQPAAGDAGGALGAALAFHHARTAAPRSVDGHTDAMRGSFLGPAYGEEEARAVLEARGVPFERLEAEALLVRLAERLDAGEVIGFCQGRAEFGPRALGARSILADARSPEMQRRLNLKIKFRESFRPFAPIVLAERAAEFFDLAVPSPYMLLTAPVAAAHRRPAPSGGSWDERLRAVRSTLPAITHVDYSARLQTVDRDVNPALHAVLAAFATRTGCPVLVNTSFNVRGEPPVCHPREALEGFLATEMDALALGPFFVEKSRLPAGFARPAPRTFAPD